MDKKTIREIAISSAMYSLGAIFAPLILIGGSGYLLDKLLDTHPFIFILSIIVAFFVTNIMLFKRINKINKIIDSYREKLTEEKMKQAGTKTKPEND
jgi:F0F1-type ATP synthase assembly protein I